MNWKLVSLIFFVSGAALADDNTAATSFATGFANALNRRMGGREYVQPSQVSVTQVDVTIAAHIDAVRNDGSLGNMTFGTYSECFRFIHNTNGFADCQRVEAK